MSQRFGGRYRVPMDPKLVYWTAAMTNFVLVAAFAGRESVLAAYASAIQHGYRFYSYGDAMLIQRA